MKASSLVLAFVALLVVMGCSEKSSNMLAPKASAETVVGQYEQSNVMWTWLDATHLQKSYMLVRVVHGQRVTIGPIKIVYICDFPLNSYGPPSPGHCYSDGSGCVD